MTLTVKFVERARTPGRFFDKHGLYLQVRSATNKSWLLRYNRALGGEARERWMGLGSAANFTLAEARERARLARQRLADSQDPIEARLAEREAERAAKAANITFRDATEQFLDLYESSWRNRKHRAQWRTTVEKYAYPALGGRPVRAIDAAAINAALAPIWKRGISETAARVRTRVERVLKWVKDGRPPPTPKVSQRRHHPALDFRDIPQFMTELRGRAGIAVRALEFLALTASRTGEVLGARWSEIDLEQRIWTVPAARMKAGRAHRVPLSDRALAILVGLPREAGNHFVFVGALKGKSLGSSALLQQMRATRPGHVPHGLRASFKTWASEVTAYPRDIVESALAHANPNKTESAYERGDLFSKRVRLMAEWARYCSNVPAEAGGAVVPMRSR